MDYFRTKSMADLRGEEGGLKRVLTATNLVLLGIGAIIGAGIFVLTGTAAAQYAGPAHRALVLPGRARLPLRGPLLRRVRRR